MFGDFEGIRCRNNECNYEDNTVKTKDYIQWLNKSCPKCSKELFKERDRNTLYGIKCMEEVYEELE